VDPQSAGVVEDHRHAALRAEAHLQELIAEYTETYGSGLIPHGDAEYNAAALTRLGTWNS
jgi:hypothetical protein